MHHEGGPGDHARRMEADCARRPDAIEDWSIVGEKIYVNRLKDVRTETSVYSLEGKPEGTVDFDGIGSASSVDGRTTDRYGTFNSNLSSCSHALPARYGYWKAGYLFPAQGSFDSSQYEIRQVFLSQRTDQGSNVYRRQKGT